MSVDTPRAGDPTWRQPVVPPPPPTAELPPDRPRHRRAVTGGDLMEAGAAFACAGVLAFVVRIVLDWNGYLGTGVVWYLGFLVAFYIVQRDGRRREDGMDRVMTVVIWSVGVGLVAVLGWMIVYLAIRGIPDLTPRFFTQDMVKAGPLHAGGGAAAAIIGSAEQVGLAMVVVVPIAILTAVYLHEMKGPMSGPIRFAVDSLAGIPSIVGGLIVYTVWVAGGHGFSGVAGSAALAILALPTVIRASEETLRVIPDSLREASMALGAPQWRVVARVVLPTAVAGLTTGVILGTARVLGETAPLLLTTGYNSAVNANVFHGFQASLPVFAYTYVLEPNKAQNARGFTAGAGNWHATCQGCGWHTSSPKRQVAASVFRLHIQAMRAEGAPPEETPVA